MKAISMYQSHYDVYILDIDSYTPSAMPGFWNYPSLDECNVPVPADSKVHDFHKSHGLSSGRIAQIRRSLGRRRSSLRGDDEGACKRFSGHQDYVPPKTFSWRDVPGVVGPPRDQVACGSCWAFGTAEAMEGQLGLKTGIFRPLSVNQVMDCTWDGNNNGCNGGEAGPAYRSMVNQTLRVTYEEFYPYIGVTGQCKRNIPDEETALLVKDCLKIDPSTKVLKEAIATLGPATIGINVPEGMLLYTDGAYTDMTCTGAKSDLVHEVLLTGWTIIDGKEAWEIKNSWSSYWGKDGYIYIQSEDQEHNCGVTTDAKIPIIDLL